MYRLPFNDEKERARLLVLLKRSEVLKTSEPSTPQHLGELLVMHHPQLEQTSEAEIEQARSDRRPITHLRVERAPEGFLLVKLQSEEAPHIAWASEDNAPQTLETVYRLDSATGEWTRTREWAAARYGQGCRVVYDEVMEA